MRQPPCPSPPAAAEPLAPVAIGPVQLNPPLVLAPLAGYTDLPFRLLCREHGAGLCVSEMVSCHGLVFGQRNTFELMRTVDAERPFGLQLFGADPEALGRA
jgi:tRNA-dihydrouridine synthase